MTDETKLYIFEVRVTEFGINPQNARERLDKVLYETFGNGYYEIVSQEENPFDP